MIMFIAASFIRSKSWKQHKYPSAQEWMNCYYIHAVEYDSVVKREKHPKWWILTEICMNLKWILGEINQSKRVSYCMISKYGILGKCKIIGPESRSLMLTKIKSGRKELVQRVVQGNFESDVTIWYSTVEVNVWLGAFINAQRIVCPSKKFLLYINLKKKS